MPTKRRTGAAAVSRMGVNAGTIESSNGSARDTPMPRRNVRRGRCLRVTNMVGSLPGAVCSLVRLHAHLELRAADDAENDTGEAVVLLRHVAHDRADGRHVRVLHAAAEGV